MLVNKIERLSSGNVLLSYVDSGGIETPIKAFFPDSGATMMEGNLIRIARQNGSDFQTFAFNKVKTLIGLSGVLAIPTSKAEFYKLLFTEFFVDISNTIAQSIVENQQQMIELLDGPSHATSHMPTNTKAQTPGTYYMLRTIRAKVDTTISLKLLNATTLTNDAAFVCIFKNPMIVNGPNITYADIMGSATLEEGTIEIGDPTPQTRSMASGGEYVLGLSMPKDSSINVVLNKELTLQAGDVLFYGLNPNSPNLEGTMYQYILQK